MDAHCTPPGGQASHARTEHVWKEQPKIKINGELVKSFKEFKCKNCGALAHETVLREGIKRMASASKRKKSR